MHADNCSHKVVCSRNGLRCCQNSIHQAHASREIIPQNLGCPCISSAAGIHIIATFSCCRTSHIGTSISIITMCTQKIASCRTRHQRLMERWAAARVQPVGRGHRRPQVHQHDLVVALEMMMLLLLLLLVLPFWRLRPASRRRRHFSEHCAVRRGESSSLHKPHHDFNRFSYAFARGKTCSLTITTCLLPMLCQSRFSPGSTFIA
jgi:hypothetical protein